MSTRIVLPPDRGRARLDRTLAELLPDVSRSTVKRWIEQGRVTVGGRVTAPSAMVAAGDVVDIEPGSRPPSEAEPDPSVVFSVVYEDECLVVVDKPAGLVVHPARGHWRGTLVNGLLARPGFGRPSPDTRDHAGALRPGIVHRIDKDTSGLLMVAKDERTREHIKAQLAAHSVERSYVALTVGVPSGGVVETLYGRHPRSRLRFTSCISEGRRAVTHVELVERFGRFAALVRCRLETGRTHQIRVHLAEQSKTPLLADALYGGLPQVSAVATIAGHLGRQALHAEVLGFEHPSGERLRFVAPWPADFASAHAALSRLEE